MNSCNNINLLLKIKKVVEIYVYNLVSENIVCQTHCHSSVDKLYAGTDASNANFPSIKGIVVSHLQDFFLTNTDLRYNKYLDV